MKKRFIFYLINFIVIAVSIYFIVVNLSKPKLKNKTITKTVIGDVVVKDKLIISAVGDCTLGTDPNFAYNRSFTNIMDKLGHDYSLVLKGVRSVLGTDDLTIANLESTFTESTIRANKKYTFKAPKSYAQILPLGSVEVVNVANNHIYDYLEVGYNDTLKALDEVKIPYFGEDKYHIYDVKGLKVGLIGYYVIDNPNIYKDLDKGMKYLKDQGVDLIFVTFHWGIELMLHPLDSQRELAHYAIDNGADLIIGHHPHIIQGIEKYKDKHIVYSLANFSFGGNQNPKDKDSFIFQQEFDLENGKIVDSNVKIIPVSISSQQHVNDYQPQILTGEDKERALEKVLSRSYNFDY